jgi:hypothetical protein
MYLELAMGLYIASCNCCLNVAMRFTGSDIHIIVKLQTVNANQSDVQQQDFDTDAKHVRS